MSDYPPPLDKLLTLGSPRDLSGLAQWEDYLELGFESEHVPDLIRMATDPELLEPEDAETDVVWAPVHAWRLLGVFRAEAAVEPLLEVLRKEDEQKADWATDDIPQVFARIGSAALPRLAAFLTDTSKGMWARARVGEALKRMAREHPETREECVAIITRQLERLDRGDTELNGILVSELLDLKAEEAAPVIQRAFDARSVDESIVGRWEHVEWELGLRAEEPPPYTGNRDLILFPPPGLLIERPPRDHKAKAKGKAKRKEAAKARKRNRKKK
jgi:Protein of unknown function (DUF1186)